MIRTTDRCAGMRVVTYTSADGRFRAWYLSPSGYGTPEWAVYCDDLAWTHYYHGPVREGVRDGGYRSERSAITQARSRVRQYESEHPQ